MTTQPSARSHTDAGTLQSTMGGRNPQRTWHLGAAMLAAVLAWTPTLTPAQEAPTESSEPSTSSNMDAELFYQLLLGEMQLREGEPGAAYSLVLDAARKTQRAELYRRAIDIALQSRSGPAALNAAQEWARADTTADEPQRFMVQILLALNRPTEAAAPLRALVQNSTPEKRDELIRAIPVILARVPDKAAALQAGQEALQKALSNPATAVNASASIGKLQQEYARQLTNQAPRDYAAALKLYRQATDRLPGDPDVVYEHAMAAEKAGQPAEMERLLRQLIEAHPSYYHAYNALGYSLADRNERLAEAKALIQKAVQLAPDDAYIQDSLGWAEFRLGHLKEASRILGQAFKLKPDAEIAAHWGEVLWAQGQAEQARNVWRDGLKINPDNETLRATLLRLGVEP